MKKIFVLFLLLLIFLNGCYYYPQDEPSDTDNSTSSTDDDDETSSTSYYPSLNIKSYTVREFSDDAAIYGEVQNTGDIGADFVKINATLKDSSGTILDVDFTYLDPSTLPSGSCYGFTMYTDALFTNVATVNLTVSYNGTTSDNPESGLSIGNISEIVDGTGDIKLLGEITNNSSELKTFCSIDAIFYDASRKVVYCDFTYADPSSVGAGYTNSFEMYTDIQPSEYNSYKLYVTSSDNY